MIVTHWKQNDGILDVIEWVSGCFQVDLFLLSLDLIFSLYFFAVELSPQHRYTRARLPNVSYPMDGGGAC